MKNHSIEDFNSLPDAAFIRPAAVAILRCCSIKTVWRHAKEGLLPPPVKLSPKITGFNVGALRAILNAQAGK